MTDLIDSREVVPVIAIVNVVVPDLRANEVPVHIGDYAVDVQIKGLFARISTSFSFVNKNNRAFEGELEFPLPDGAVVCGYAIDIDGEMTPACVVEKQKARIAFENEVKKGADPGLVEHVKANAYRTRIYPLPANGSRRIRLDYITPLVLDEHGNAALSLPMPNEKLAHRDVVITAEIPGIAAPTLGGLGDRRFEQAQALWRVEAHETDVNPQDHLLIGLPALPEAVSLVEINDGDAFFLASVHTEQKAPSETNLPKRWRILWDASGSRQNADIEAAMQAIAQLPESAQYELHVFRNTLDAPQQYETRTALANALRSVACDGGSNFAALKPVAQQTFDGMTLLFSDGIDTFTGDLPVFGANATALTSGSSRDMAALRRMCGGLVIDLNIVKAPDTLAHILNTPRVIASCEGNGISNVQGIGAVVNGRATVLGRLQADHTQAKITLSDGSTFELTLNRTDAKQANTIASAWAASRIDELSPLAEENREELLALGRHFNIVSPVSSMIVFETLEQWLEYDIEPPKALESLHAQWLKLRTKPKIVSPASWEAQLAAEWQKRLEWWKSPVPKKQFVKSGLFDGVATAGRNVMNAISNAFGGASHGMPAGGARNEAPMEMREAAPMRAPMAAPAPLVERCVERCCECEEVCCDDGCSSESPAENVSTPAANASISIQAWDPNVSYLTAIKDAAKIFKDTDSKYAEYLRQRQNYKTCPAFFLDCAGYFFKEDQRDLAIRILSNLSELRLEDTALLRVYAWRLREAGALDESVAILRKILKMRDDEVVSWRDLALTLTLRAKKCASASDASEALELFKHAAFTPWQRRDAIWTSLVALEEFNALVAWCDRQKWSDKKPDIPQIDKKYQMLLDTDLRIVMMWDADDTDIDLHVLEPSGEEVFFRHQLSETGGMVSHDVVTGYGPEEFLHKKAPAGCYKIMSNYYASHQQKLTGPVTVTVTVFTNWGREKEMSQTMSLRLENCKDHVFIGSIDVV